MFRAAASIAASMALSAAIVTGVATAAGAESHSEHAVFIQTDSLSGNQVVAFSRDADGSLAEAGRYSTGGLGGLANGAVVDPLASQGSLAFDAGRHLLYAVNAGSNTVSVFRVRGTTLDLRDVVPSGGTFPASITVRHDLVFVLNAGGTGSVNGFRVEGTHLQPIGDGAQGLGLAPVNDTTQFLNTAGQIGFTPDGRQLVVTTKANGSHIDVLSVRPDGSLSAPVANTSWTPVPFAFVFGRDGTLQVVEAGASTLSTYSVHPDGTISHIGSVADGQAALCWIATDGSHLYGANAGSASVSRFSVDATGTPALEQQTAASTNPGSIDSAVTPDGSYLYVETGKNGTVDGFHINSDGTLTSIGSVTGLAGLEGIAVS
jgi:6-phosphogluconolactonase (cycloisomerase 2 family)